MFLQAIHWPMRLLVDASLLVVHLAPSSITLLIFAVIAYRITKIVVSLPMKLVGPRLFSFFLSSPTDAVGRLGSRVRFFSIYIVLKRLPELIVGVPMFNVFSLMYSPSESSRLRAMATGYPWQQQAFNCLPLSRYENFSTASGYLSWGQNFAAFLLIMVIYNEAARGFALVRACRRVSDQLVTIVPGLAATTPSITEAAVTFSALGWSAQAIKSALWFLSTMNMRVTVRNAAYENQTPASYGVFQVLRSVAIVSPLTYFNPAVGAFYLVTKVDGQTKTQKMIEKVRQFYGDLPDEVRAKVQLEL